MVKGKMKRVPLYCAAHRRKTLWGVVLGSSESTECAASKGKGEAPEDKLQEHHCFAQDLALWPVSVPLFFTPCELEIE